MYNRLSIICILTTYKLPNNLASVYSNLLIKKCVLGEYFEI